VCFGRLISLFPPSLPPPSFSLCRIKVEVAIGRGIRKYDKREAVKEREIKRGFEKIMKSF